MTSHTAWLGRRSKNVGTSPRHRGHRLLNVVTSIRRRLRGIAWYRLVLAALSVVLGSIAGWMFVTHQWHLVEWPSLDDHVSAGGIPIERAVREFWASLSHLGRVLRAAAARLVSYYIVANLVGGYAELATESRTVGAAIRVVLFLLLLSFIATFGISLFLLGLCGAMIVLYEDGKRELGAKTNALQHPPTLDADDPDGRSLAALEALAASSSGELTASIQEHLAAINAAARSAIPRLCRDGFVTPELLTARGIVGSHVPETLRRYLAVPSEFRAAQLADGRTVTASTDDQLARMRQQLDDLLHSALQPELHAVAVQDAFVSARFPATPVPLEGSWT